MSFVLFQQLITGKKKLEKKLCIRTQEHFRIHSFAVCTDLNNSILKNEPTLTMQNIDITQATTSQLRVEKEEL